MITVLTEVKQNASQNQNYRTYLITIVIQEIKQICSL